MWKRRGDTQLTRFPSLRADELTWHRLLKALAVLAMLLDHAARVFTEPVRTLWTLPAQLPLAMVFYWLVGTNPSQYRQPWPTLALVCAWALLEVVGLPRNVQATTLVTIAALRRVLAGLGGSLERWSPLQHGCAVAALIVADPLLGWEGLNAAYGTRAVLYAVAGHLRTLATPGRAAKGQGRSAAAVAWPLWLGGGAALHLVKNYVNVLRPAVAEGLAWAAGLAVVLLAVQVAVLAAQPLAQPPPAAAAWLWRPARRALAWLARHSLGVYVGHILAFRAMQQL